MTKHLTLLEEAQHRAHFNSFPESERQLNEDTYVSLMGITKTMDSKPQKQFSNVNELLEDLGLGEFAEELV